MVTKQYQKGQCGKYEILPKTNTDKTRAGFSKRRAAGQHLSPDVPAGFLPLRARGGRRIRAGPWKACCVWGRAGNVLGSQPKPDSQHTVESVRDKTSA